MIRISNITGRISITPPTKCGVISPPVCAVQNLTLRVKREGTQKEIARYPAVAQDGHWEFVIDDVWRTSKPGFYIGTVFCCEKPLGCYRFHLIKDKLGEAKAHDMRHPMCQDLNAPVCPALQDPCASPCPPPPSCQPTECYTAPECEERCRSNTGHIDAGPPCNKQLSCVPC